MTFLQKIESGIYPSKENFIQINTQQFNRNEICQILNISVSTYKKLRRFYGLEPKRRKVKPETYISRQETIQKTLNERYGVKGSETRQDFEQRKMKKMHDTCKRKYGVEDPTILPEFIEKRKETCLSLYGVSNPMQNSVIQEKAQMTNLQKYGTKFHIISDTVQETIIQNNLKRYGVPYTSMLPSTTEKRNETNLQRYGYTCSLCNPEIRKKGYETMSNNGTQAVLSSSQQNHLNQLFGGILNYLYGYYHIDSYIKEDKIGIEYSGSGHNLSVRLGRETEKTFLGKEQARKTYFKKHGLPIVEFVSTTDILPSDEKMYAYYNNAKEKFQTTNYLYCKVDLDRDTILFE